MSTGGGGRGGSYGGDSDKGQGGSGGLNPNRRRGFAGSRLETPTLSDTEG